MVDRKFRFDRESGNFRGSGILEAVARRHPELGDLYLPMRVINTAADEVIEPIRFGDLKTSMEQSLERIVGEKGWTGRQLEVGGTLVDGNEPRFFVPMVNIRMEPSSWPRADALSLENSLCSLSVNGDLVMSDGPKASRYTFVGHDPIPYSPNFWQLMGRVLVGLSLGEDQGSTTARVFGDKLLIAINREESVRHAEHILEAFSRIQTEEQRLGLFCYPEEIAQALKGGVTFINVGDEFQQVARYY